MSGDEALSIGSIGPVRPATFLDRKSATFLLQTFEILDNLRYDAESDTDSGIERTLKVDTLRPNITLTARA